MRKLRPVKANTVHRQQTYLVSHCGGPRSQIRVIGCGVRPDIVGTFRSTAREDVEILVSSDQSETGAGALAN